MEERRRALVLGRVVAGRLSIAEGALLLGLSERSVWRLKSRFVAAELDPAALVHGNAGRLAAHRLDPALVGRVVAFARDGYAGINDTHLSELLAEREGIRLSRSSVRRILRRAGIASPRRRRAPAYRSRRARRAAAGMLVQLDASRHRWFGAGGPFASLHSAIDAGLAGAARGTLDRERVLLQVRPHRRRRQHRAPGRRGAAAAAAGARRLGQPARRAASVRRWLVQRARARWTRARTLSRAAQRAAGARP